MCRTHRVLILVALYMKLVHSWDIAISVGDRIEFYDHGSKTGTIHLVSHNPAAITYDEVHNMILFVDKQSDYDAVCCYNLDTMDIRCFVKRNGSNIQHLAFDPPTELLFFTDTNEGSINWISLKDQGSESNVYGNVLIKMNDRTVNDIALDSCSGYIYWTNIARPPYEYMERARFNGAERELVNKFLPVFSFAIDPQSHINYYINGYEHEFHNEVDLRKNNLNDEESQVILHFQLISQPKELTVTDDNVYWMNSTVNDTTVWQRPKIGSDVVEPKEMYKFYGERPLGIAANYKIKDQVQRLQVCDAPSSLVPIAEITNNSLSIEQKQPTLETDQTTERESTTERKDTADVELTCVHGTKINATSVCKCTPGYVGKRCDVVDCGNYCLYGDCSFNDKGLPECRCNNGYSGQRCEINTCFGFCLNGGECSFNERSEPICQCKGNYVGDRCEVSRCLNYCFQGNCSFNDKGHPVCRCNTGYSGERCEVNKCNGYCLNGGDCSLNGDEPSCECGEDYVGTRCETVKNNTSTCL
ncbi:hypothetical protein PYW07_015817 [Mythimna separata]|uniref:EGF-like domain-containing protein n=1 Tax=Mythimna separata TaxID=271217 RepID=A0AAD7YSK6_MYTSE|nr:hypothetical protein PYW07_015817 [Mythimna separata]